MPSCINSSDCRVLVKGVSKRKPRRGQAYERRQAKRAMIRVIGLERLKAKQERQSIVNENHERVIKLFHEQHPQNEQTKKLSVQEIIVKLAHLPHNKSKLKSIQSKRDCIDIYGTGPNRRLVDADPRVGKTHLRRPPVEDDVIDVNYKTKLIPLERVEKDLMSSNMVNFNDLINNKKY